MVKLMIKYFFYSILPAVIFSCKSEVKKEETVQHYDIAYYFDEGKKKLSEGKPEEAISSFNKAIQIGPNIAELYVRRGIAKSELKDYESAIKDFEIATKLSPLNISIINEKGIIEYKAKLYDDALKDFDYVLSKDSTFSDSYLNRGLVKVKLGLKKEGCEDFYIARTYGSSDVYILIEKYCQ